MPERALARINLAAIERNVERLCSGLRPGAQLCAVVKADGYGHGAAHSARAALAGGARMLAVATADEAIGLREAEIGARILVMGALSGSEIDAAIAAQADVVAWTEDFIVSLLQRPPGPPVRVHVKLDTGMGRLGTRDPAEARRIAHRVLAAAPGLELAGAMTHFATSDDDAEFMGEQLRRFEPFVAELRALNPDLIVHAANSAATLREPNTHFDLVRCGIAIYGCDPMNVDPEPLGLEPALELTSYVAAVKRAAPGESAGYGRRFVARRETWLATVPIGYGDGVRRGLTNNCDVLIAGRRFPLVGTVSMDNVTVEVGAPEAVRLGDTAILIGRDGPQRQTAEDVARRLETISYEVLTGLSARVPRRYHFDGDSCDG